MKLIWLVLLLPTFALAQVDVASRRLLSVQSGIGINHSEEAPSAFGLFLFNENHCPWDATALRVIFAGVYGDAELSYFLPAQSNTAVGVGLTGAVWINGVTPYWKGERIEEAEFTGDLAGGRVFVNQTLVNPTPLPLNLRATYAVKREWFHATDDTADGIVPAPFTTHTLQAELRWGGVLPGLLAAKALELYVAGDLNYRDRARDDYRRLFAAATVRWPVGTAFVGARLCGGTGADLDELSAWKLGGNLKQLGLYTYTLHGYYTREFIARDFALANLAVSHPLADWRRLTGHLYLDHAIVRLLDDKWRPFTGLGAGLSCRAWWDTDVLVSYGYGVQAVRDGHRGGHEIALALERRF